MFSWFRVSEEVEKVEKVDVSDQLRERQFNEIKQANKVLKLKVIELNGLNEQNKAKSIKSNALLTESMVKNDALLTEVSITNEALLTANQQHSAQMLLVQCQHGDEIKKHEQLQESFDEKVQFIEELKGALCWTNGKIEEHKAQFTNAQQLQSEQHLMIKQYEVELNEKCKQHEALSDNNSAELTRLEKQFQHNEDTTVQLQNALAKKELQCTQQTQAINEKQLQCAQQAMEIEQLTAKNDKYRNHSHELADLKDKSLELTLQNQEYELEIGRLKDDEALQSTELAMELMRESLKRKEAEILQLSTSLADAVNAKTASEKEAETALNQLKESEPQLQKLVKLNESLKDAVKAKKEAEEALKQFNDAKPQLQQTQTEPMVHGDRELQERLQCEAAQKKSESKRRKRARSDTEIEPEDAPSSKRQRVSSSSRCAKAKDDASATITERQATYAPKKKCKGTTFVGTERISNGRTVHFTCKWLVGNGEECLLTFKSKKSWQKHCIDAHTLNGKPIAMQANPWKASSSSNSPK